MTVWERSTRRLSPEGKRGLVEHAEEELPKGVTGFLNFVEKQEAEFEIFAMVSGQGFLGDQRMSLAMAQIAGGEPISLAISCEC